MNEHELTLSFGTLAAKAVKDVDFFNDKTIKLTLTSGVKLLLCGENLRIVNFSKQTAAIFVAGQISRIAYLKSGEKFFKRLLK